MVFDFSFLTALAAKAYKDTGCTAYSLPEVLEVFNCYFETYERYFGQPHPNIRMDQIERIITIMPYIDRDVGMLDIHPDSYPYIIEQHFQTPYRNCDFNINHFFSGKIRELRFYEAGLY